MKIRTPLARLSPIKTDKSHESSRIDYPGRMSETGTKVYTNYLEEVKRKRMEQEKKGIKAKHGNWESVLKSSELTKNEKVSIAIDDISRIDHQAKIKEERLKQHLIPKNLEREDLEDQVTDLYLEAIRAKLAIVDYLV